MPSLKAYQVAVFKEEMEARIYEFHLNSLDGYQVTTSDTLSDGLEMYLNRSMKEIEEDMADYEEDVKVFLADMEEISKFLSQRNEVEELDIMKRDPGLFDLQTEYKQKMTDLSTSLLGLADTITKDYLKDNDLDHENVVD